MDLADRRLPLAPVPRDVEDALGRGAQAGTLPPPGEAATFPGLGARFLPRLYRDLG